MLKFDGLAVGTKIRAYDFQPMSDRPDRFVEGIITSETSELGPDMYTIDVTKDTGFPENPRIEVFVPKEVIFMEYDNRIEVI